MTRGSLQTTPSILAPPMCNPVYVNQAVDMDVGHLGLIGGTAAC